MTPKPAQAVAAKRRVDLTRYARRVDKVEFWVQQYSAYDEGTKVPTITQLLRRGCR